MLKAILKVLPVSVLVFAISACSQFGVPTVDPNSISTFIAQTMAAYTPTASAVNPVLPVESPTSTLTVTAAPPGETPSPTLTVTALPISTQSATLTPLATSTVVLTPGAVQVTVSVDTNCRVGPGVAYTRVGMLRVGETASVVGRNAAGNYWIIQTPGRTNEICWLWGEYATLTGDTNALSVFTPPAPSFSATPVTSFDVAYEGLESCSGTGWWVDLGLENIGNLTFRSITFTIEDRDAGVTLTQRVNGFTSRTGCNTTETRDTLPPDVSRTVSSPVLTANPDGHRLRATITLCSNTGQSGTCITQSVNMTP